MLPDRVRSSVESTLGTSIHSLSPASGGSINQAARVETADTIAFLKWHPNPPPAMFEVEADGLRRIDDTETVRVPEVLAVDETWLLLEWLPIGSTNNGEAGEQLGRQLAELHRTTADSYGLAHDNYIGSTPQQNGWFNNWVTFWCERRLRPQMELARERGRMTARRRRLLERMVERAEAWFAHEPPASLLHGDLWSGNWMTLQSGKPALVDPAVYYGDREADVAMTQLFGGFPQAFHAAYREMWPLPAGFEERRDLYNLYHLLNHLNLFGGSYGASVDRTLERYVGE